MTMHVLRPIELGVLTLIMFIGIASLVTELTQFEQLAKYIVIPSLCLLIIVTGYTMFKRSYQTY